MGIRQKLNQNSAATSGAAAALIILALVVVVWQAWPRNTKDPNRAYFTVDEGQTYFVDDIRKDPPFDKDGKVAVRAQVVRCGRDKPFVAFVERFTPEAKKYIAEMEAKGKGSSVSRGDLSFNGAEIKRPGETEWIKWSDRRVSEITTVHCPNADTVAVPLWP